LKEIFEEKQRKFHDFSQNAQRGQDNGADSYGNRRQKIRQTPPGSPHDQQIDHRPQYQDQGHKQPKPTVSRNVAQQKKHQRRQKAEQQIRQEPEPVQAQLLPQSGHQVVHQSEQGTAGQGNQGLQPLPFGGRSHQPSSLPIQPRRPGVFSE